MKHQGQIEPIVVRRCGERFELLAGERRLKAAVFAGLGTLRSEVVVADDRQAAEIVLAENLHRRNLSAIEVAQAYQQMIDLGLASGPGQVAARMGIAQATVSNRLRLLPLPPFWHDKLISREITERHARAALPYLAYPSLMEALERQMRAELATFSEAPTVADWESEEVAAVVSEHSRPLSGEIWDAKRGQVPVFEVADEDRERLAIILVDGVERATNLDLWEERQAAWVEKLDGRRSALACENPSPSKPALEPGDGESGDDAGGVAEDDELRPADVESDVDVGTNAPPPAMGDRGQEATGKDFASRLWAWKSMFLRRSLAGYLFDRAGVCQLLGFAMIALTYWDNIDIFESDLLEAVKKATGGKRSRNAVAAIAACDDLDIERAARKVLALSLWSDLGPETAIPIEEVLTLHDAFELKLEEDWRAGDAPGPQGYFELHTKAQLLAIAEEVKLLEVVAECDAFRGRLGAAAALAASGKCSLGTLTKAELADMLVAAMTRPDSKDVGIPMPKEIARAKAPKR